jgi:hypothetical protein
MIGRTLRRYIVALMLLSSTAFSAMHVEAAPNKNENQTIAPTFRVFATREGLVGRTTANGHVIKPRDRFVALPCWCSLSPKGSSKFSVRVTYKGRSVVLPVWDVGPWNTKDDYWNVGRRYSDLPVGRPMAHAAYYDGYNGGRDERGRRINNPNGIDIADGAFWDDLGMTRNDYVEVSFLWLGYDPGAGGSTPAPAPAPAESVPPPPPVEVEAGATAIDNGAEGYTANNGPWTTERCGLNGSHTWTYSTTKQEKSTNLATWSPKLPTPGFYEVKAHIPACGKVGSTQSARYRITHDGAVTEMTINQEKAANSWVSLGTYYFGGNGSPPLVELSDLTGDDNRAVRYDVIAWAPRTDTGLPDATILAITRKDNGYRIQWGGTDDISGIASYDVQVRRLPNGGWTDWRLNTADTEGWFGPDEGDHFAFRVRGRDWAGNQEAWPENADMDTTQAP